jgi:hypothetical protein
MKTTAKEIKIDYQSDGGSVNMKQNTSFVSFTGRMIVSHFLTYFVIGLLFYVSGLNVIAYYEQHPQATINSLFRDMSSLLVTAGPLFQLMRGFIFALALYPFRTVFLERKFGWLYLWGIFLAFAIFAPSSAAPGSIEGIHYFPEIFPHNLPARDHTPNVCLFLADRRMGKAADQEIDNSPCNHFHPHSFNEWFPSRPVFIEQWVGLVRSNK